MRRPSSPMLRAPSLALWVLAATQGCATLPLAPAGALPTRTVPTGLPADTPAEAGFRILPGDMLSLDVSSVREQRIDGLPVDAQGSLHVPGTGDVTVGGLTIDDAERRIEQALRRQDRRAEVTVRVAEARGHRMTVLGAVPGQQQVVLRPGMRLSEAFATAAPATVTGAATPGPLADLYGARLIRGGVALPVDLPRALAGDPAHDVTLRPGDLLYVPPATERVVVFGQVRSPTAIAHREGLRMTEALAQAGGITQGGDRRDLRIIRGPAAAPIVYRADLLAITRGERSDVALEPGDVIFVTDHAFENASEGVGMFSGLISSALVAFALSLTP